MKKLLIALLLVSPFSSADWGDVYYCQMTTYSETTLEGERTDYKLEEIQFKLDKAKNAMLFGGEGDDLIKLREGMSFPSREYWHAAGKYEVVFYREGKLLYTLMGDEGLLSLTADCDK